MRSHSRQLLKNRVSGELLAYGLYTLCISEPCHQEKRSSHHFHLFSFTTSHQDIIYPHITEKMLPLALWFFCFVFLFIRRHKVNQYATHPQHFWWTHCSRVPFFFWYHIPSQQRTMCNACTELWLTPTSVEEHGEKEEKLKNHVIPMMRYCCACRYGEIGWIAI